MTPRLAPALAALVLATATAAAFAQAPAPAPAAMNFQQVVDRVVAQGYSDVREVERKSEKLYEIKARNSQNRWVELYVDARTGETVSATPANWTTHPNNPMRTTVPA
jgi:predicted lipoprotein